MSLNEVLVKTGIGSYIENIRDERKQEELLSKCSIDEYRKGDIFYYSPGEEERALIFIEGRVNIRIYVTEEADYVVPWNNEYWLGIPSAVTERSRELEINIADDTRVLSIPLREILYADPRENVELWMRLTEMAVKKYMDIQKKTIDRSALSTEAYFMKSLAENGGSYEGSSIQDISYELNINTRTLQRVVQGLERRGYIKRERSKQVIYIPQDGGREYNYTLSS